MVGDAVMALRLHDMIIIDKINNNVRIKALNT